MLLTIPCSPDERRKARREKRKEKKDREKKQQLDEKNRLQNLKREEIVDRMKTLGEVTGMPKNKLSTLNQKVSVLVQSYHVARSYCVFSS